LDLKEKGLKVLVNTRDFKRVEKENSDHLTARKLVLPIDYFGFNEIDSLHYLNYKIRRVLRKSNTIGKFISNDKIFQLFNDKNFNINHLKKKNYFIGHWQNLEIIKNNKKKIEESISNNTLLKKALNNEKYKDTTLIHVRRGDYLKFNEELPISYYEKSIELIKHKSKNTKFMVYTDDIAWCKKQNIFKIVADFFTSTDSPQDTVQTFSSMLQNKNFIIANSTFSLLAATLGKKKNSIITYPDPWFKFRNYNKNITDNDWERINY
tara:strand:- start:3223 stop:4017 length:795 start_codon:yes stop_codon:yes gene_type:complete